MAVETFTGIFISFFSFEKKVASVGCLEISLKDSRTSKYSSTFNPLEEIEIPAPYSLIFSFFSKITHGMFYIFKILPNARPAIPAATIKI